ncbi:unnamed protein product [Caenorhabditis angaria]|uniref:Cyanocobalamin reductase (cyanide-eliminating) n=1 Tax=Caenorhabditis angaria TaxID=860376 RepID=A0A9P1I9T2_9PELO|nr:unnamed protein product [Caenorhabditis angaria]
MIGKALEIKKLVDQELPEHHGFESHMFKIGSYNSSVSDLFTLPFPESTMALLILSTPDMFDVAFRKWIVNKTQEEYSGNFDEMTEELSSPIQMFLEDRLENLKDKLELAEHRHEILHDYSLTPQRRPRILMQTCGHVAGAAYYYQPRHFADCEENWPLPGKMGPNLKFIGLSLHPVYGGHFAFRSVLIFPDVQIPEYVEEEPKPILTAKEEVREALEKFNYNWKDSGFRDFGCPTHRYSATQMEFFGRPVSERWEVLRPWIDGQPRNLKNQTKN